MGFSMATKKGTKFSFTTAEGKVETRTSPRAYTHVVVGRRDYVKERAHLEANRATIEKQERRNWEFYRQCAQTPVGEKRETKDIYPNDERNVEMGQKVLDRAPTADAFVAEYMARQEANIPAGDFGPEIVLQWSQSARAALAAVSKWSQWHTQVRVVELKSE